MNQMHNYLKLSILVSLFSLPICLQAQDNSLAQLEADAAKDSVSLSPTFSVDFTGEIQSDFKRAKFASLLELGACIPLSRNVSIELSSVSFATTHESPLIDDLQGFSNLDADNLPFALSGYHGTSINITLSSPVFVVSMKIISAAMYCRSSPTVVVEVFRP